MTNNTKASVALIVQACRHIEQAETRQALDQLAAEAGLSPWYFHRLFKKIVGVTPKQYATRQQTLRFRDSLHSEESVTAAIYDAGFSSSSRAYDKTRDRLAMTPSDYRKAAEGLTIRYALAPCFLGWIIVAVTDRGICAIEFGDNPDSLPALVQARFRKALLQEGGIELTAIIESVIAFVEAPSSAIELPLDIQGSAFQERVWNALRSVPPGSTVSYTDIACQIGSPKAVRAVAQACAANKLAVVIPCHRVVRSDGNVSGYRWGVERKRALLLHEKQQSEG
ncbi:methylated-DNA--[protein]-cysteine S-methyltransferase [Nitrincola sp. A-D6]|uniref:methylated-DNA--[protein]-cysteine S-methyltransferase n=1 Tax=Nitrincola sp. A-D6 TaxID=1545442 RepID=UPI00068FA583|nr:methylated-DNA--[protein]-cysteine S-methyltransferase [Nitrincola sp. A-D6]